MHIILIFKKLKLNLKKTYYINKYKMVSHTFLKRLCWFCQSKCDKYVSICYSCENDIKKKRKNKFRTVL